MAALAPSVVINNIQPPPVIYGVSADDFQFSFALGPPWEMNPENLLFNFDISIFCIPQFGSQYMLNCVAPSGAFVLAGDIFEPLVQAAIPVKNSATTALAELRAVVRAIRESQALPISPAYEELLTRAAQARGTPKNIKEWANRLAADISELVD